MAAIRHPVQALAWLLAVALAVEVCQYWPEPIVGLHAIGEIVRNLAYALVGALAFHWLVVELPAAQRRRKTYEFHRQHFEMLVHTPLTLITAYEITSDSARQSGVPISTVDPWDQDSVTAVAQTLSQFAPQFFGPNRVATLKMTVDMAVPKSLSDLAVAVPYLDADVAHALSLFPRQEGLRPLQVDAQPDGSISFGRDVYITWTLLEAARSLYSALLDSGAYGRDLINGRLATRPGEWVELDDHALLR